MPEPPQIPPTVSTATGLRLRHEYFGALVWIANPRRIHRLPPAATALTLLHQTPRPPQLGEAEAAHAQSRLGIDLTAWAHLATELLAQGVLVPVDGPAMPVDTDDIDAVASRIAAQTPTVPVLKPLWVHLQPFTRCNQRCLHCYCSGGPQADDFLLDVPTWLSLVGKLDDYGVLDIYVTGGESLLRDGFFAIAEEILDRGMGFGVSTNATVLSERVIARLRQLRIGSVQVSLDGGTPATHELIRGASGSFTRTLAGIDRISEFCDVVINTVVNKINIGELEQVVQVGIAHGCRRFKFFPQKPVGRSSGDLILSDSEIMHTLRGACARLADAHGVEIETVNPGQPCGNGSVGFAVDQRADIYPCIFGVENPAQRCGNLLADDLDEVWFTSPILAAFRGEVPTPCRRCEC
ncbi:radical SAM protein [Micromonosporaceae bacterium B7E4]